MSARVVGEKTYIYTREMKVIRELLRLRSRAITRNKFVNNEVKKDRVVIVWRDVDDEVHSWNLNAGEVMAIGALMGIKKREKMKAMGVPFDTPAHDDL